MRPWNTNKSRKTAQDFKNSVKTGPIHIGRGVSERKMAENLLRESEDRYRLILERVNVIGWEYDPSKDCFTFVSGNAQKITGYTPEQWRKKGFWASHIHPKDRDFAVKHFENAIKRGEAHEFEYRMITADEGFVWFRVIVQVLFYNDKVVGLRGIFIDVTERKQAEKTLSDYKEQMYAFSLATTNMLWNWNLINNTVERNIGFEKAFGYTKKEIVPNIEWWVDRLHPDDSERIFSIYKNAVKKGHTTCSYEYRFRHNDGNYSYISDTVYIVRDEKGKAIRSLGAMSDITSRKEAEDMQREQKKALEQKNAALSELIGHIEHEKQQVKDNVMANTENLLLPILEKIRLEGESGKYINLLRDNLQELTSSFGATLTGKKTKLTCREIEICNMIKNGLASKEIADLLNISLRTIEKHRTHIRNKLSVNNRDISLYSFLKKL